MADNGQGDKTEQPTDKKLQDARLRGQMPKSSDLQTLAVLTVATCALSLTGGSLFNSFREFLANHLTTFHTIEVTSDSIGGIVGKVLTFILLQSTPIVIPIMVIAVVATGLQTKFQIASKALELNPSKMNPVKGIKKIIGWKQFIPAGLGVLKLSVIIGLTYSAVISVIEDPLFYAPSDVGRLGKFIGGVTMTILTRICIAMLFIGILDFIYQKWQMTKDMMMSKQEVKDEQKSQEGNPEHKARQKQTRSKSFREMLNDVPQADAIITNPTHLSIAIKYDRKSMKAPQIIAKGARNNALKIREIAKAHQIPIVEDKPVARMLFKYGKVGGEIPSQLFNAVAEILAYVYRINAYRYYRQESESN